MTVKPVSRHGTAVRPARFRWTRPPWTRPMSPLQVVLTGLMTIGISGCGPASPVVNAAPPELRECTVGANQACLRSTLAVDPGTAATGDVGAMRWSAHIDDVELPVMTVREYPEATPPTRILILVDGSASMGDGTLQIVRSVLRSFLSTVPSTTEVAVAPFSSVRVEERIEGADFDSPDAAAGALLDFPPPNDNTGLYSAIQTGARRLGSTRPDRSSAGLASSRADWDSDSRQGAGGTNDHLIVVTDGTNDVGSPGDDSGLLQGVPGRDAATQAVVDAGVHLWVVGVGDRINRDELESLATGTTRGFSAQGRRVAGHVLNVPLRDPVLMGHALDRVDRALRVGRELIVRVPPWARRYLDRGPVTFTLRRQGAEDAETPDSEVGLVRRALWTPPLFTAAALGPALGVEGFEVAAEPSSRWQDRAVPRGAAILAVFSLGLVILSQVVPPFLWPVNGQNRGGAAAPRGTVNKKGKHRTALSKDPSGEPFLLSNVRAAPPRGVDDETRSRAEQRR